MTTQQLNLSSISSLPLSLQSVSQSWGRGLVKFMWKQWIAIYLSEAKIVLSHSGCTLELCIDCGRRNEAIFVHGYTDIGACLWLCASAGTAVAQCYTAWWCHALSLQHFQLDVIVHILNLLRVTAVQLKCSWIDFAWREERNFLVAFFERLHLSH